MIHPIEKIILKLPDEPKSLRRTNTQMRKNQKVPENNNNELIVKNYPKNK